MSRLWIIGVLIVMLAACNSVPKPLPTPIEINEYMTHQSETSTALAPTATVTRIITQGPTFTPGFVTQLPTNTLDISLLPTNTPFDYNPFGTLYYLYNNDTIASVRADGENARLVKTFGVGQQINSVTLSPDGKLLAYVGPGAGSGREVYVSSLDGTFTQKVSCLGFAYVDWVTWAPDSQNIAFFAAPLQTSPGDIYIASYIGANTCPDGNGQRLEVPFQTIDMRGMTFNLDGSILYYAGGGIDLYAWELANDARYQVTIGITVGDAAPAHSPVENRLAYLTQTYSESLKKMSGGLAFVVDTQTPRREPLQGRGIFLDAPFLSWSLNGEVLAIPANNRVWYFDTVKNQLRQVNERPLPVAPDAVANPDGGEVAYTTVDNTGILQIFVFKRIDGTTRQVTQNTEGTMTNLIWGVK